MSEAADLLIVEDSETQALQLRLMLENEGYTVDRAASAEEALEKLNLRQPDLMIVDYRLPGMNGDELARTVRLDRRTRTLPILMLTEEHASALERQGLDSGASAYVPKSNDRALLVARLKALLRRGRDSTAGGPGAFRRATLLLVQESAVARLQTADMLERDGYTVVAAGDPAAALAAIARGGVDCVAIGFDARGYDPYALCREVDAARAAATGGYEILGLSAAADEDRATVMRGFAAGADDMLSGLADRETVQVRFRAAIRRKFARDEDARAVAERLATDAALAEARAEAAAAEALAAANRELEAANRKLTETQGQLVQAAKMASLGELVAGIAHEINNPLAFILAHQATVGRLVREAADAGGDGGSAAKLQRAGDRLESMKGGLARIQDLVMKLRRFSRLDESAMSDMEVAPALDMVMTLLSPKLGDGITVVRRYDGPATLFCSAALINQVVMNLVANAADAMEGRGCITVATRGEGDRFVIEIGDDGPGIPAEQRERIFEPFYTTKAVGTGTGLGLAIAYGVVRSHRGTIVAGESPQGGALFTVTVPRERQA